MTLNEVDSLGGAFLGVAGEGISDVVVDCACAGVMGVDYGQDGVTVEGG